LGIRYPRIFRYKYRSTSGNGNRYRRLSRHCGSWLVIETVVIGVEGSRIIS
jgi:hypothetical protein